MTDLTAPVGLTPWNPPPLPMSLPPAPEAASPLPIGVMIPNLNDRRGLIALIDSLAKQTYPTRLLQIVIADNGSQDDSVADFQLLAKAWSGTVFGGLEILPLGENLGAPKAYNAALRRLSFLNRAILKLDSDVILQPDCIARLFNRLQAPAAPGRPAVGAVGGREYSQFPPHELLSLGVNLQAPDLRPTFPTLSDAAVAAALQTTGSLPVTAPAGACTLYDAALLRSLGGLDESFFVYYDDIDLGLRVRLQGRACLCDGYAVYRHRKSGTVGARATSAFHRYHEARSSLLFGRKYRRGTAGESARFAWRWNLQSNFKHLATGHPGLFWAGVKALWHARSAPLVESQAPLEQAWTHSGP